MKLLNEIKQKAKKIDAKIILPEANLDKRVYEASKFILKNKLSKIVVFGEEKDFDDDFKLDKNCEIIDFLHDKRKNKFISQLFELRKHKGITEKDAKNLIKNPIYFACMMLKNDLADGMVAGAKFSTAETLLPALQIIKAQKDKSLVTGSMIMLKEKTKPLLFGDVSLITNPTSEELSEIAISNAEFMQKVLGIKPYVAMLSYSTYSSAESELTLKVKKATELAKRSKYIIDGEMQADAALNLDVAKQKGVKSKVGGNANVLIFPDLNAGNISYKLTSRLGGYTAIGPIMLNFNKPVNDLSRGSKVQEIINTVLITKLQTLIN